MEISPKSQLERHEKVCQLYQQMTEGSFDQLSKQLPPYNAVSFFTFPSSHKISQLYVLQYML
jgi:hypothetical protein